MSDACASCGHYPESHLSRVGLCKENTDNWECACLKYLPPAKMTEPEDLRKVAEGLAGDPHNHDYCVIDGNACDWENRVTAILARLQADREEKERLRGQLHDQDRLFLESEAKVKELEIGWAPLKREFDRALNDLEEAQAKVASLEKERDEAIRALLTESAGEGKGER